MAIQLLNCNVSDSMSKVNEDVCGHECQFLINCLKSSGLCKYWSCGGGARTGVKAALWIIHKCVLDACVILMF